MGHRLTVRTQTEGRAKRTVMSAKFSNDDLQFKIFGWGGRKVPEVDRDPYLNSEFPDLASRVKVEFNDAKKLTSFLANAGLRESVLEAPAYFPFRCLWTTGPTVRQTTGRSLMWTSSMRRSI